MIVSLEGMEGFDEMILRLGDLSTKGGKKATKKGVDVSTRMMVKAGRKNAPVLTGDTRKSVKGYVKKKQSTRDKAAGFYQKVVGPTAEKPGKDGKKIRYPYIVERKTGWLRRTFDETAEPASQAGLKAMQEEVDVIWDKEFKATFNR